MRSSEPHSLWLKLIILNKATFAVVMLIVSLLAGFGWRHYAEIAQWAEEYILTTEYDLVRDALKILLNLQAPGLKLIARISGGYGLLLAIAAGGLWFQRRWADPLFVFLVGFLIPVEVYEIIHHATWSKVIFFSLNVLIFSLVLKHWIDRVFKPSSTPEAEP